MRAMSVQLAAPEKPSAFMTKNLYEEGMMNDDERTIFAAYQYAGSAVINNTDVYKRQK